MSSGDHDGHTFCMLKEVISKSRGSEVWTFGFLIDINLSEGFVVISDDSVKVNVNISMLDSVSYQKGGLYTCLAYVEKDCVLLAKILKLSNGLDTDMFVRVVTNQSKS
jgi:hypothetical protein